MQQTIRTSAPEKINGNPERLQAEVALNKNNTLKFATVGVFQNKNTYKLDALTSIPIFSKAKNGNQAIYTNQPPSIHRQLQ